MAVSPAQDISTFKNPAGYWTHQGAFSVELIPDANKSIVPPSAEVEGDIVRVRAGRIKQSMGGTQLYSAGARFCFGYSYIKVIRDGSGNLLWVNYNYR
jgi:hypothetical protein